MNLSFVKDTITKSSRKKTPKQRKNSMPTFLVFFKWKSLRVILCSNQIKWFIVCCELEEVFVEYNLACKSPLFPKNISLRAAEMWNNLPYCMKIEKGECLNASRNKFYFFLVSTVLSWRKLTCAVFPRCGTN